MGVMAPPPGLSNNLVLQDALIGAIERITTALDFRTDLPLLDREYVGLFAHEFSVKLDDNFIALKDFNTGYIYKLAEQTKALDAQLDSPLFLLLSPTS